MILDDRLIGSKCAECATGRDLILGECLPFDCQNCKNRPRKWDTDNFRPEYKREDTRKLMDEEARKTAAENY